MGRYINQDSNGMHLGTSFYSKCRNLISDGAVEIEQPSGHQNDLVCVVDNGMFAAVGYCYDEREVQDFRLINDRPKRWFLYKHAEKLAQ